MRMHKLTRVILIADKQELPHLQLAAVPLSGMASSPGESKQVV